MGPRLSQMWRALAVALFIPAVCPSAAAEVAAGGAPPAGRVYWVDYDFEPATGDRFSLHRSRLDGSFPEEVVHDMGPQPQYASLAVFDGVVYWNDFFGTTRAATTGGDLLGPASAPNSQIAFDLAGIELDPAGVYTYIPAGPDGGTFNRIQRGDFEAENRVDLIPTRDFMPNLALALDADNRKLYWAGAFGGAETGLLQRADLDGTNVQTLIEGFAEDDFPLDLNLDVAGGKLYLANDSLHRIQRANLDGTGLEDIALGVAAFSVALDLPAVPEPAAAAAVMLLGAGIVLRRRRTR